MADGVRLAARIWLPVDAEDDPVPAVLEYLPYRRRDGTALRDAVTQPYLAGHGYAAVRVDVRGTGDSEGVLRDEYDRPEREDGVAIVAWLAAQTWCSGRVGMWGISWGGFNALQVASLAPPALRAIIPIGFAQDRYDGDCHFMGGCLLEGTMSWGHTLLAGTARPPDPEVVGDGWRAQWLARLAALEHPIGIWLEHQRRDDYWKPGSPVEDLSRITAAVFAVGGWQDSYSRNVLPLLEGLRSPCLGLIGPWAHGWPHLATPGPRIGFLQEALRWWDFWLKDIDTGIMDGPKLRAWIGEWAAPRRFVAQAAGRFVAEDVWPPVCPSAGRAAGRAGMVLHLAADGRLQAEAATGLVPICSPQTLGATAGHQCAYGMGPDLAGDQREDDALSSCFDTAAFAEDVVILGAPEVELVLSCDRAQGMVAARLCEVAPDGASLRLSYGLLNLCHRDGAADPQPLVPGERYRVRIALCALGHRVAAGHRLRLALSTAYWPIAWPSPEVAVVSVEMAGSFVSLPVRPVEAAAVCFGMAEGAVPAGVVVTRAAPADGAGDLRAVNPDSAVSVIRRVRDRGAWRTVDTDVAVDQTGVLAFSIHPDDPLSARQDFSLVGALGRAGWQTEVRALSALSATREEFVLEARLEALEGDEVVFAWRWDRRFPRDMV